MPDARPLTTYEEREWRATANMDGPEAEPGLWTCIRRLFATLDAERARAEKAEAALAAAVAERDEAIAAIASDGADAVGMNAVLRGELDTATKALTAAVAERDALSGAIPILAAMTGSLAYMARTGQSREDKDGLERMVQESDSLLDKLYARRLRAAAEGR